MPFLSTKDATNKDRRGSRRPRWQCFFFSCRWLGYFSFCLALLFLHRFSLMRDGCVVQAWPAAGRYHHRHRSVFGRYQRRCLSPNLMNPDSLTTISFRNVDDSYPKSESKVIEFSSKNIFCGIRRRLPSFNAFAAKKFPMEEEGDDDDEDNADDIDSKRIFDSSAASPPLVQETSRVLRRVAFLSWWSQVILTTVSGVILGFARQITPSIPPTSSAAAAAGLGPIMAASMFHRRYRQPSYILSGMGIVVSAVSILWTWGNGARLSRRLISRPTTTRQAAHLLRRAVRVGVTLNLIGLLLHLLAAEQIVGMLAIRVLSLPRESMILAAGGATGWEGGSLQPIDVLVVQANTNSLLSHFCSLVLFLILTRWIDKLDPPSSGN